MFLTRVLMFYKHHKGMPGLLRAGKNRAIPHMSQNLKRQALQWLMLEQQNLELLSKPYLTLEEEFGSAKARKTSGDSFLDRICRERYAKMLPHRTHDDIFANLYKKRSWE